MIIEKDIIGSIFRFIRTVNLGKLFPTDTSPSILFFSPTQIAGKIEQFILPLLRKMDENVVDGFSGGHGFLPSRDRPPAIHRQADAGDVIVLDEERHGLGDVFRPAETFEQRAGDRAFHFMLGEVFGDHDRAGQNAVHADRRIAAGQFDGEHARQGGNGPFARKIGGIMRIWPRGGPIADRHDRAPFRLPDHDFARPSGNT